MKWEGKTSVRKTCTKVMKRNVVFTVLIGIVIGVVLLLGTQKTLEFTDSGEFCGSCHVMNEQHDSYASSSHATVSCNDCHLPHQNEVKTLIFKTKIGLKDIYYNTLAKDDIPDVIHASRDSVTVIQDNCVRCHSAIVNDVSHDVKSNCTDCHRGLPHQKQPFKNEEFYKSKTYYIAK